MRRNCLVTGANRGIGLEFVRQLLARGEHVVAACRHPGKATALNGLAGEHPGRLHMLPLDVAEPKSRANLLHELPLVLAEEEDGSPGKLDLVVNNAGVLHSGERFGHMEQALLEDSLRTNAIGPFLLSQALAPLLRDIEGERVRNVVGARLTAPPAPPTAPNFAAPWSPTSARSWVRSPTPRASAPQATPSARPRRTWPAHCWRGRWVSAGSWYWRCIRAG